MTGAPGRSTLWAGVSSSTHSPLLSWFEAFFLLHCPSRALGIELWGHRHPKQTASVLHRMAGRFTRNRGRHTHDATPGAGRRVLALRTRGPRP